MAKPELIYKGRGFFIKVPARDLSKDEVQKFGRDRLLASGLYAEPEQPKPRRSYTPKVEDIEIDTDTDQESED